jgi:hypothetical protein
MGRETDSLTKLCSAPSWSRLSINCVQSTNWPSNVEAIYHLNCIFLAICDFDEVTMGGDHSNLFSPSSFSTSVAGNHSRILSLSRFSTLSCNCYAGTYCYDGTNCASCPQGDYCPSNGMTYPWGACLDTIVRTPE